MLRSPITGSMVSFGRLYERFYLEAPRSLLSGCQNQHQHQQYHKFRYSQRSNRQILSVILRGFLKSKLSLVLVIKVLVLVSLIPNVEAFLHLQQVSGMATTASNNNSSSTSSTLSTTNSLESMMRAQMGNMSSMIIVPSSSSSSSSSSPSSLSTPMTNGSLAMGPSASTISSNNGGEKQQRSNNSIISNNPNQSASAQSSSSSSSGSISKQQQQHSQTTKTNSNNGNSPARLKQQQQQQQQHQSKQQRTGNNNDNQIATDDSQHEYMTLNNGPSISSDQQPSSSSSSVRKPLSPSEEQRPTSSLSSLHQQQGGKTTITTVSNRANGWPSNSQWRAKQTTTTTTTIPRQQQQQQQQQMIYMNQQPDARDDTLDASLTGQMERPSGYSYGDPAAAGNQVGSTTGYTYVSQISPAKQEITEQQQRNRARQQQQQQQQHHPSISRAYEPMNSSPPSIRHYQDPLSGNHVDQLSISSSSSSSSSSSAAGSKTASQLPQFNTASNNNQQRPSSVIMDAFATANQLQQQQQQQQQQHHIAINPCKPLYANGQDSLFSQMPASSNEISSSSSPMIGNGLTIKYIRAGAGTRLRSQFIFKVIRADSLTDCELACTANSLADSCRSFNYRAYFAAENCELSRLELRNLRLEDGAQFEQHTQFDFYAMDSNSLPSSAALMMAGSSSTSNIIQQQQQQHLASGGGPFSGQMMLTDDCLDVSQSCTQDGMEFTLRTSEPFNGRIYTYGFYDSCFVDGQGSTSSQLRISRSNGFPRCGTQQFGDLMTNIVVVQFNDYVQTTRDKKYNLTCYFSGPGEAVVTSNYLDTKIDERSHPIQIEHLPPQNVVTSNVHLRILYRGQPTNTIAVGDLLTFRLETRPNQPGSHLRGELSSSSSSGASSSSSAPHNEIFATNVIAKDPYSGRQVQLIDSRGCPIDPVNVFPELQRTPDGALESEFYAFKIPDSNFLIFQATVRTCKAPCEPVICQSSSSSSSSGALNPVRIGQHQLGGTKGQYLMGTSSVGGHLSQVPSWGKRKRKRRFTNEDRDDETEELLSSGESIEHVIPVRMSAANDDPSHHQVASSFQDTRQVQTIRGPELGEAEQEVKEMFRVFMSRAEISKRERERQQQQQQIIRQPATILSQAASNTNGHNSNHAIISNNGTDNNNKAELLSPMEALPIHDEHPASLVDVCMTQSSYYVILFTVISMSLILLSIVSVCLYVTRRTKLHISDSIADSMVWKKIYPW